MKPRIPGMSSAVLSNLYQMSRIFKRQFSLILLQKFLTYNGEYDNHKIKYIPANSEIIVTESNQFQETLRSKNDNENQINPI